MSRALLSALLVASLLACPFRCLTCCASEAVVEVQRITGTIDAETSNPTASPSGCGCCESMCPPNRPTNSPNDSAGYDRPASSDPVDCPSGSCECTSCLCSGAILPDTTEIPDANLLVLFLASSDDRTSSLISCAPYTVTTPLGNAKALDGRGVRIAIQSLLI